MTRYYDVRASNREGTPEDQTLCIASVSVVHSKAWLHYQCTRNRGHGPDGEYCKQHAAMLANKQHLFVPEHRKAEGK